MFWSTASFELADMDDMKTFPLRSLLTQEYQKEGDTNGSHSDGFMDSGDYYDAKSNIDDNCLELNSWVSMNGIRHLLKEHDEVRKVQELIGQIVQVARLSPKQPQWDGGHSSKPERIVVANTHLFYHPMADHIRVMQAYAICHKLDEIRRQGQHPDPVLICGDFNSGPLSGKYFEFPFCATCKCEHHLMGQSIWYFNLRCIRSKSLLLVLHGTPLGAVRLLFHRSLLPNDNDCWKHLNVYKWECGDNEVCFHLHFVSQIIISFM